MAITGLWVTRSETEFYGVVYGAKKLSLDALKKGKAFQRKRLPQGPKKGRAFQKKRLPQGSKKGKKRVPKPSEVGVSITPHFWDMGQMGSKHWY